MVETWKWGLPDGLIDLICPECMHISLISEWIETEIGCHDCGEHSAIQCPKCGRKFDHVWDDEELTDVNGEREFRSFSIIDAIRNAEASQW